MKKTKKTTLGQCFQYMEQPDETRRKAINKMMKRLSRPLFSFDEQIKENNWGRQNA